MRQPAISTGSPTTIRRRGRRNHATSLRLDRFEDCAPTSVVRVPRSAAGALVPARCSPGDRPAERSWSPQIVLAAHRVARAHRALLASKRRVDLPAVWNEADDIPIPGRRSLDEPARGRALLSLLFGALGSVGRHAPVLRRSSRTAAVRPPCGRCSLGSGAADGARSARGGRVPPQVARAAGATNRERYDAADRRRRGAALKTLQPITAKLDRGRDGRRSLSPGAAPAPCGDILSPTPRASSPIRSARGSGAPARPGSSRSDTCAAPDGAAPTPLPADRPRTSEPAAKRPSRATPARLFSPFVDQPRGRRNARPIVSPSGSRSARATRRTTAT